VTKGHTFTAIDKSKTFKYASIHNNPANEEDYSNY
jgi:hypothetical protein